MPVGTVFIESWWAHTEKNAICARSGFEILCILKKSSPTPNNFMILEEFMGVGEKKFHIRRKSLILLGVEGELIGIQPICIN